MVKPEIVSAPLQCHSAPAKETMFFQVGNGTLIIMAGTMQRFWKHEIPKTKELVGERINLTFREIVKRYHVN